MERVERIIKTIHLSIYLSIGYDIRKEEMFQWMRGMEDKEER
jgi:hypothetical protein